VALGDDALAWELRSDASWARVAPSTGVDAHSLLEDLAQARVKEHGGAPDELRVKQHSGDSDELSRA
jgi:hypothetical protein